MTALVSLPVLGCAILATGQATGWWQLDGEVAGMTRVLSSEEARTAITQMQNIINGGLTEQIRNLDAQGQRLSDPNVWDGKLAADFRGKWPETNSTLNNVIQKLEELRNTVHSINSDIMSAGGNH